MEENRPLISVLVISYNNADLIYDALDSVFMQDYPNIELIISDDASPRPFPTDRIIQYVNKNRRENIRQVILNQNPENLGTVRHMERIRAMSHGEIELVIAADDAWADSGVFTAFADEFERLGPEAECITSQLGMFDRKLEMMTSVFMPKETVERLKAGDMEWLRNEESYRCVLPSIGTAYRRSIFDKLGKFSDAYTIIEDYSMHVRMTRMRIPVYYLDRLTAKHRAGGISHGNTRAGLDFLKKYHADFTKIYQNEIAAFPEEYTEEVLSRARKYDLSRQKTFQQQQARLALELSRGKLPQNGDALNDEMEQPLEDAALYRHVYIRDKIKGALQRISTLRQVQLMLIVASLALCAGCSLQNWKTPFGHFLSVALFWVGVVCLVGFALQVCINILFKLRRLMWHIRERKG